eukprot:173719_1
MDEKRNRETIKLCDEDITLLIKILKKIIDKPDTDKYRDINIKEITKRINNPLCIDIFKAIGFKISTNGLRLILHKSNVHRVQFYYWQFVMMSTMKTSEYACFPNINTSEIGNIDVVPQILYAQNNKCELKNCPCLKNIGNALLLYDQYIQDTYTDSAEADVFELVHHCIKNTYNNTELLNDFNHLLRQHAPEIHAINNILTTKLYD